MHFLAEMKGLEGSGLADQGTRGVAVLKSLLLMLHLHALSLIHCLPHSLILSLCLSSFLLHSPFILDLLSWRWWVSPYDMELSVRNTKPSWDRFSTLHRSLWRTAPFLKSTVLFAQSASRVRLVPLLKPHVLSSVSIFSILGHIKTHVSSIVPPL